MDYNKFNTYSPFWVVEEFATEKQAQQFTVDFLRKHGFVIEEQVTLPSGNRIDIIAMRVWNGKSVTLPIEVKPRLFSNADFAPAAFQANSYSQELGLPVFVGPIMRTEEANLVAADRGGDFPLIHNGEQLDVAAGKAAITDFGTRVTCAMSFMCRLNVGLLHIGRDGETYTFQTDPARGHVMRREYKWGKGYVEEFSPKYWGLRERSGSNARLKRFMEGDQ
jgi:hypothetical protein